MSKKNIFSFLMIIILLSIIFNNHVSASHIKSFSEKNKIIQSSLFSRHWKNNDKYNNYHKLIGLEYYYPKERVYGIAFFKNSYNQGCCYLYIGRVYYFHENSEIKIRGKISAGIVHGYSDEGGKYDGIYNKLGTFPAIIPSIGIEYSDYVVDLVTYALAGAMITIGIRF